MSRFYITKIAASGDSVKYSTIEFKDGINLIVGPSNTGKSYIISCIDFMMAGKEPPFSTADTGYNKVSMTMDSNDGHTIIMTRAIEEGESGDKASNVIEVDTDIPDVRSGEYKISDGSYQKLLLKLLGIDEPVKIISTQAPKTEDLSFRTMWHLFFLDEEHIFCKGTVFDNPKYSKITASLTSLLYLANGDNLERFMPSVTPEELERRATQKAGVINYLNQKISDLTKKKEELEESLGADTDIDIDRRIEEIVEEIESIEAEILSATEKSKKLLEQIYSISAKLQEARYLQDRYKELRSQYMADTKRLQFVVDGNVKGSNIKHKVNCPFCGHGMEQQDIDKTDYIESARAELARIRLQLEDLDVTEAETKEEVISFENQLRVLNAQNNDITAVLNHQLKPKAAELKATVAEYKRILHLRQQLQSITYMSTELGVDVFAKENEDDETAIKFDAKKQFDKDVWADISAAFDEMVKDCQYPGQPDSYISVKTADAVVGGKHKKNQGKGYRAYLNTIMLFNLMKYLEEHGEHALHLLVLDSPILSLKEKKHNITENEKATAGMKTALFRHMIEHCGNNQIIIAENELPADVDYSSVNMLTFTQEENDGERYGFLHSVRN